MNEHHDMSTESVKSMHLQAVTSIHSKKRILASGNGWDTLMDWVPNTWYGWLPKHDPQPNAGSNKQLLMFTLVLMEVTHILNVLTLTILSYRLQLIGFAQ
jgi:hypothetical protein